VNENTGISWCNATLNPLVGCARCSKGCMYCYAEDTVYMQSHNVKKEDLKLLIKDGRWSGEIKVYPERLDEPFRQRRPTLIFLNSMSDYFYEKVPLDFIQFSLEKIGMAHWHFFQILTKRGERLHTLDRHLSWPDNVCMGVSVENGDAAVLERIDCLRETRAAVKFLSVEPLIGPLPKLNLANIDWVIVGGESGPEARPMEESWVIPIRDQCIEEGVPFFFKQWGGRNSKAAIGAPGVADAFPVVRGYSLAGIYVE